MVHDVPVGEHEETTYECMRCGQLETATSHPGECSECGGDLRNHSMAPE